MGVAAATLTAFYMCRMMFLTFFGEGPKFLTPKAATITGTTTTATVTTTTGTASRRSTGST
jgi:NADH:ubiquinone oxidoreductase subunit 5 (subunit L)/multisubunit Na+/H+ antiporter MnhA subunit